MTDDDSGRGQLVGAGGGQHFSVVTPLLCSVSSSDAAGQDCTGRTGLGRPYLLLVSLVLKVVRVACCSSSAPLGNPGGFPPTLPPSRASLH